MDFLTSAIAIKIYLAVLAAGVFIGLIRLDNHTVGLSTDGFSFCSQ